MPFRWGKKDEPEADTSALDAFELALPGDPGSIGPAAGWTETQTRDLLGRDLPLFTTFLSERARSSVGGGALRFLLPHTEPSLVAWNARDGWHSDWPSLPRGIVFATDWMGRLFMLLSSAPGKDSSPALVWLDTMKGELIRLNYSFGELLRALATDWRGLTDADRLDEWRSAGNEVPRFGQVIAPKQPLLLGGSDAIAEMELSDLAVAVSFGGQIWEQVKDLAQGTPIKGVSIQ